MSTKIPRKELLADLQRVADEIGHPPSESEYQNYGEYSPSAVRNQFGKFTKGRIEAGLGDVDRRGGNNKISRSDLLDSLLELRDQLGKTPTREEMREIGAYSEGAYRTEFGSWNAALEAAGFEKNRPSDPPLVEVACESCDTVKTRLESYLRGKEHHFCSTDCLHEWRSEVFTGENHPLTHKVERECSSCRSTIRRRPSVMEGKENVFCDYECAGSWWSDNRVGEDHPRWRGGGELYYGPNWMQQRRRRLEFDSFTCQSCGISESELSENASRGLDVHHRKSVRSFYEESDGEPEWEAMNRLGNLVSLCISCHRKVEVGKQVCPTDN